MTAKLIVTLFILGACLLPSAQETSLATEPSEVVTKTIDLEFVEIPPSETTYYDMYIEFDSTSTYKISFPTQSGELTLQYCEGKLKVDRNGDGKIDDSDGGSIGQNDIFKVTTFIGDREVQYPFRLEQIGRNYAWIAGRAVLIGHDSKHLIMIYDSDLDGKLGEPMEDTIKCTTFLQEDLDNAMKSGDHPLWRESDTMPVAPIVSLDNTLFDFKMDDKAGAVVLKSYVGKESTVDVKSKAPGWQLRLSHTQSKLHTTVKAGNEALVVPGEYQVHAILMDIPLNNDSQGESDSDRKIAQIYSRYDEPFHITIAEGENSLEIGPPFQLNFEAYAWGKNKKRIEIEDAYLQGVAGEQYMFHLYGKCKPLMEVLVRAGESEEKIGELSYG